MTTPAFPYHVGDTLRPQTAATPALFALALRVETKAAVHADLANDLVQVIAAGVTVPHHCWRHVYRGDDSRFWDFRAYIEIAQADVPAFVAGWPYTDAGPLKVPRYYAADIYPLALTDDRGERRGTWNKEPDGPWTPAPDSLVANLYAVVARHCWPELVSSS